MTKERYLLETKNFIDAFFNVDAETRKHLYNFEGGRKYIDAINGGDFFIVRTKAAYTLYKFNTDKVYGRALVWRNDFPMSTLLKAYLDAVEEEEN